MNKAIFIRMFFVRFLLGWCTLCLLNSCNEDENDSTALSVTRVSPDKGAPGETVSISGKGFSSNGKVVSFNGRRAEIESITGDTLLKVIVPQAVTSGFVEVKIGRTTVTGPLFTVLRNTKPAELVAISTEGAEAGEVFTITGKNFAFATDSALARNIVRVGGVRTSVISGTETTLQAIMPALPEGPHDVTVTVLGEPSNALSINLKSFPGILYWSDVPGPGAYQTGATQHYVLSARADGTTRLMDKTVAKVPSYLGPIDINNQWNILGAFNPVTNVLFYRYLDLNTYQSTIHQVSTQWNDFSEVVSGSDPNLYDQHLGFSNPMLLMAAPDNSNTFYLYADNTRGGEENIPYRFLGAGVSDGTFSDFHNSIDQQYFPDGIFGALYQYGGGTASNTHLYFSKEGYNPVTTRYEAIVYRLARDGSSAIEQLPFIFSQETVQGMAYNVEANDIYLFTRSEDNTRSRLYAFSDDGTGLRTITDAVMSPPRSLNVLSTPTGIKVYWIAKSSADVDGVWMLNYRPGTPSKPILLYSNMQEIYGIPQTRINDSFQAFYPPYICTFLIADNDLDNLKLLCFLCCLSLLKGLVTFTFVSTEVKVPLSKRTMDSSWPF